MPYLSDGIGCHLCTVGDLPPQLAALNRTNINVREQMVRAVLEGDRSAVHHAVALDSLTSAECDRDEIHQMTEELLEANADYIPDFS